MKKFNIIEMDSTDGKIEVELVESVDTEPYGSSVSTDPYRYVQSSTNGEAEIIWNWRSGD